MMLNISTMILFHYEEVQIQSLEDFTMDIHLSTSRFYYRIITIFFIQYMNLFPISLHFYLLKHFKELTIAIRTIKSIINCSWIFKCSIFKVTFTHNECIDWAIYTLAEPKSQDMEHQPASSTITVNLCLFPINFFKTSV